MTKIFKDGSWLLIKDFRSDNAGVGIVHGVYVGNEDIVTEEIWLNDEEIDGLIELLNKLKRNEAVNI